MGKNCKIQKQWCLELLPLSNCSTYIHVHYSLFSNAVDDDKHIKVLVDAKQSFSKIHKEAERAKTNS